jgi:periplasmic divalent cation tolerance protein
VSDIVFLYVTAPDPETAHQIARTLITEKLAACVNISAPMTSIYEWQGAIEETAETAMIVKTTASAVERARDRIIALHPHDTPCIAAMPISAHGSAPAFLDWAAQATNP